MTPTRTRWFEKFARLRPGMDLQQVCNELNEPYGAVYRWADIFRYPFPDRRRRGRVSSTAWDQVDWKLRDAEIARALGVSRERVRQVRAARGEGPSEQRAWVQQFTEFVSGNVARLNGLPVADAISLSGHAVSHQVARRILRSTGVKAHDPASRWRGVDWRLPNRDLALIWGTRAKYIANVRARLRVGPAAWDAKSPKIVDNAAYRSALAAERQRGQMQGRDVRKLPPMLAERV